MFLKLLAELNELPLPFLLVRADKGLVDELEEILFEAGLLEDPGEVGVGQTSVLVGLLLDLIDLASWEIVLVQENLPFLRSSFEVKRVELLLVLDLAPRNVVVVSLLELLEETLESPFDYELNVLLVPLFGFLRLNLLAFETEGP